LRHLIQLPVVRESVFYEKLADSTVQCSLCERRCRIPPGNKGFCKTRLNVDGKLCTVVYGNLSALESRPIEIKPFFHYWPGSTALTFSTWSCNFDCVWCQNWSLSKKSPDHSNFEYYTPEEIVELAVRKGDGGLCSSFQEPTLLTDWNLDLFKIGHANDLYCCYVSNGYMTHEALKLLWDAGMDGLKVDVKGDAETYGRFCGGADVDKVWRNVKEAKAMGFHVEIVNLVVPDVNDDEEGLRWLIERHLEEAGPETPLHFTRYYPAHRFDRPATPIETLEKAYELATKLGVLYPYIGNVAGHRYENTYCPNCRQTLIKRYGSTIVRYSITNDRQCPKCGSTIPIRGKHIGKRRPLL
jgi:pyruvate formate lyase activating enzyme